MYQYYLTKKKLSHPICIVYTTQKIRTEHLQFWSMVIMKKKQLLHPDHKFAWLLQKSKKLKYGLDLISSKMRAIFLEMQTLALDALFWQMNRENTKA